MKSNPIPRGARAVFHHRLDKFRTRTAEGSFWLVQAGVVTVTLVHLAVEAMPFDLHRFSVLHVPVFLYLVPISYAGYRYGLEGGVLTGIWTSIVAAPNVYFFHRDGYAWVGELVHVLVVVVLAVIVSIPVERQRRAREHAEETGQRLALLNSVIAALGRSADLRHALAATLRQLIDVMHLEGAAVELRDGGKPALVVSQGDAADAAARLVRTRRERAERVYPVTVEDLAVGHLAIVPRPDRGLTADDHDTLTAVGGYIGVAFDNALLHAREKGTLRSYAAQVTRVQEDERTRMARELHDEVAQELIVLARDLEGVANDGCRGLAGRTRNILSSVRRFSRDLRPAVLDDLGLVAALRWLASDLSDRTAVCTAVEVVGASRRLAPEVEVALFRIAQEALRNAERHASPKRVDIRIDFGTERVEMLVSDDGIGFEPQPGEQLAHRGSYGILGMKERTNIVNGRFTLNSQPRQGTEVRIEVSGGEFSTEQCG